MSKARYYLSVVGGQRMATAEQLAGLAIQARALLERGYSVFIRRSDCRDYSVEVKWWPGGGTEVSPSDRRPEPPWVKRIPKLMGKP